MRFWEWCHRQAPAVAGCPLRWLSVWLLGGFLAVQPHFSASRGGEPPAALAAQEPVMLRYRFHAGEAVEMRVAHRALTETTLNGATEGVETATDSLKRWHILDVDDQGNTTIEHSVDDVTMLSRASGRDAIRWSSASDAPPPAGYEGVRQSLRIPLARIRIDASGRVLSRLDLHHSPTSNTGDLMVVPLPDQPVRAGSEWTVPQEVVVEVPGGPRRAVRTRLRYSVDRIEADTVVIDVDTTVLTPIDDPRLEARLLERIWDGRIEFDRSLGRVRRRSTGIDRRVVGFQGADSSVRYKSSLEETLVESDSADP